VRAKLLSRFKLPAGAPVGEVHAALNTKDGNGDLPIHHAVRDTTTGPELVGAMLDAGGEAMLGVPNYSKRLPLHHAADRSWSPAVVALLLARGPAGAARAENGYGRTPLALAEKYTQGPAAEEIQALLRAAMQ
jgi:ankyrin repeat protein